MADGKKAGLTMQEKKLIEDLLNSEGQAVIFLGTEANRSKRLASVEAVVEVLEELRSTYSDWDYRDLISTVESAVNIVSSDVDLRFRVVAERYLS